MTTSTKAGIFEVLTRFIISTYSRYYLLLACIILAVQVPAQVARLGVPLIRNFDKDQYAAGTQNWDIDQGPWGGILVANNDGLLHFNGDEWSLFRLPNQTIVRSVRVHEHEDGFRIYVGGQGELGYFLPDSAGRASYQSLTHLLPETGKDFDEAWDLVVLDDQLYFRSLDQVFCLNLSGGSGQFWAIPENASHLYVDAEHRYAFGPQGIYKLLDNGEFQAYPGAGQVLNVRTALDFDGSLLVCTERNGLFKLENDELKPIELSMDPVLEDGRIYRAQKLSNGYLALATSTGGLLILDKQLQFAERFNSSLGLQKNNVLSLHEDRSGNIWLGLDNGIDMLAYSDPMRRIFPDGELAGTAYCMIKHEGLLYFGTNSGLYYVYPEEEPGIRSYKLVSGSRGQVWNLYEADGQLLMGHHEGVFQVDGGTCRQLSSATNGVWGFIQLDEFPDLLLCGTYSGIAQLRKQNSNWVFDRVLDGFNESSRLLAKDQNGFWVAHPYRGTWFCELDESGKLSNTFYGKDHGIPDNFGIQVFDLGTEAVFAYQDQCYRFNHESKRFELHEEFSALLGDLGQIKKIIPGHEDNLWFVEGKTPGLLQVENKSLNKKVNKIYVHRLSDEMVGGFEYVYDVGDQVFFASDQGFIQLDRKENLYYDSRISLDRITMNQDSTLYYGFGGQLDSSIEKVFNPGRYDFEFKFSHNDFRDPEQVSYSWYLEGLEEEWSSWSDRNSKEYTKLGKGQYTFHVKAQNRAGQSLGSRQYAFTIEPAWFDSQLARLSLLLIGVSLLLGIILVPRRRFAKERAIMATEQEQTLREQEERHQKEEATKQQEISALRNERLRSELDHQNQELAMATMHLVQKNSMISKIKEAFRNIDQLQDPSEIKKSLRQVTSLFGDDERLDDDWEQFALRFDRVHADFLSRLKEQHPQLTPKDLKLCAFLRMNLSSKEIAPLLNISVRGVEISRYRLRKKLDLSADTNLVDFLLAV